MTPGNHSSGSDDDDQQPREPAFNWGLTPTEPEPETPELPELVLPDAEPPALTEPPPTEALNAADLPTAAINSSDLPTAAMDLPTRRQLRMPAAVDPALEGATEVLAAHPVSAAGPEDESVDHDAVGALFGDEQFFEYEEQSRGALVPATISRPRAPRPPIPRGQLFAISIAAGLVAALALAALFLAGTRIGDSIAPAAVATLIPTDTASAAPTVGPLPVGTYAWNELLGGECLEPFDSAWQDEYRVIECAQPHAAQLLTRGEFDDAVSAPYPEVDDLVARTNASCSTDKVINFAAAKSFADLELVASFAPTASDWDAGQRDYYCFATRTGDEVLTESVAQPQVAADADGE
ncbi:septum formation family protein [Rhodoglobus aureus]|uniref:Septum formation-related domain-containing protein n=1 Tax=Rhodoglobus aureus TaxID=191497 RepID=A0ABN1VI27_9MICO